MINRNSLREIKILPENKKTIVGTKKRTRDCEFEGVLINSEAVFCET